MSDLFCPYCGKTVATGHKVYDIKGAAEMTKGFDFKIASIEKTNTEYQVFYLCEQSNRVFAVVSEKPREMIENIPAQPINIVTDDSRYIGEAPVAQKKNWLKEKFPRIWDFLEATSVIRSERDFFALQDQLMKLVQIEALASMGRPHSSLEESFELIQAQKIAIAILVSKKNIVQKKHWWSWAIMTS